MKDLTAGYKVLTMKMQNKKALSEIIAYVLLIVISLSLASGVFIWLKAYVPTTEKEKCSEDISLIVKAYSCDTALKRINLTIENKGMFNANGFFISGSNQSDIIPVIMLRNENPILGVDGMYPFMNQNLSPGQEETATFFYEDSAPLKRIRIEPYISSEKKRGDIVVCNLAIKEETISGCDDSASTTPSTLLNELVGYWPFEGNANDATGYGNYGTVIGAILTAGKIGQAYKFDGVDDYIVVSSSSSIVITIATGGSIVMEVSKTATYANVLTGM